jgi:hypothetical protein
MSNWANVPRRNTILNALADRFDLRDLGMEIGKDNSEEGEKGEKGCEVEESMSWDNVDALM